MKTYQYWTVVCALLIGVLCIPVKSDVYNPPSVFWTSATQAAFSNYVVSTYWPTANQTTFSNYVGNTYLPVSEGRTDYLDYTFIGTNNFHYYIAGGIPRDEALTLVKTYWRTSCGTAIVDTCYIITNGTVAVIVTNGSVTATRNGVYGTSFTSNTVPVGAQLFFQMSVDDASCFPTQNVMGGAKVTW